MIKKKEDVCRIQKIDFIKVCFEKIFNILIIKTKQAKIQKIQLG